jgi:hypothetical protein
MVYLFGRTGKIVPILAARVNDPLRIFFRTVCISTNTFAAWRSIGTEKKGDEGSPFKWTKRIHACMFILTYICSHQSDQIGIIFAHIWRLYVYLRQCLGNCRSSPIFPLFLWKNMCINFDKKVGYIWDD